jgi:heme exporter protein C
VTAAAPVAEAPAHTGSRATRILGVVSLALFAALVLYGLVLSPPEPAPPTGQGDAMRLLYIHAPSGTMMYVPLTLTFIGSLFWLFRRSVWWDTLAGAAAEVGVLFTGICLVTGAIWGRPTWGTYWDWDPRLTSTALLFLMFLGYLAVRRIPAEPSVRNRRAAIVGLVAFVDVPIVHFAVEWWRSLHQGATVGTLDVKIDGLQLFTLMLGFAAFATGAAWLLIHRFRLAWLEDRAEEEYLDLAIAERRLEAEVGS